MRTKSKKNRFYIESLGCAKNLVDSENIISKLISADFKKTEKPEDADFLFVNTCCFIEDAKTESINKILELSDYTKNTDKELVVLGCIAQRYADIIKDKLPEVNKWIKITDYNNFDKIFSLKRAVTRVASLTPGHWSYLRVADGCNHSCSYCIIPKLRGKLKSEKIETLVKAARKKVSRGVKELNIIAQNSLSYGMDIYNKPSLIPLLKKICKIKGLEWIRILYMYPTYINDELIDFIKNEDKICNYFDIPLQHSEKKILRLMKRPLDAYGYEKLIDKIRNKIPASAIRTTFITGFPGETNKDFESLIKFMKKIKFDHLGVFIYSNEEGTSSYNLKKQVPETVKQHRMEEIMYLQQEILKKKNRLEIKKVYDIMIDEVASGSRNSYKYLGRTRLDAPEIDRNFHVKSAKNIKAGDIVKAEVVKTKLYDFYGKTV
ncbi:MAG: 30S ribosomal protein S12 methylthiotransferase RimO [Armatimonadota bacterium]